MQKNAYATAAFLVHQSELTCCAPLAPPNGQKAIDGSLPVKRRNILITGEKKQ